jgi:ParB family transcriptional regulator, chromosome partitioning protein
LIVQHLDPRLVQLPTWLRFRAPQSFAGTDFLRLRASIIHAGGNVQAIKVWQIGDGRSELVYGARRLQACLEAGLPVLALVDEAPVPGPLVVIELDASNEGVSLYERGKLYASALDASLFPSRRRLADAIGRPLADVAAALDLARLPAELLVCFGDPRAVTRATAMKLATLVARDPEQALRRAAAVKAQRLTRSAEIARALLAA